MNRKRDSMLSAVSDSFQDAVHTASMINKKLDKIYKESEKALADLEILERKNKLQQTLLKINIEALNDRKLANDVDNLNLG